MNVYTFSYFTFIERSELKFPRERLFTRSKVIVSRFSFSSGTLGPTFSPEVNLVRTPENRLKIVGKNGIAVS